jgi:hypothetical protein
VKKAFFINGGAGRVLCAIPALEAYKQNVDPDVVIVAEAWAELFLSSPIIRDNVFNVNHKSLFEEKLKDREIISPEPYRLNSYFNQRCNLIQAFDMIINESQTIPETKPFSLEISKTDQVFAHNLVNEAKATSGKDKVVVFQPFGSSVVKDGGFVFDTSGRSFELAQAYEIIKKLSEHYAVLVMCNIDIPPPEETKTKTSFLPQGINILQWMGIIKASDYFLGCDSMGQHYAHALNKPATVVIGSTCPENISYPNNKNFTIIDNGKEKRRYIPMRVTHDYTGERVNEDLMVLDQKTIDKIIKSVTDKLGKTKQNKDKPLQEKVTHVHGPDCAHAGQPLIPPFAKKSLA